MKAAIIGGGVIGVALGIKILEHFENAEVTIFEKESQLGSHASSRNSGVLHSGLYYGSESLKAKFSRDGNLQLRKFIKAKGLPLIESGKLILTKDEAEVPRLFDLANRAASNGVDVSIHASGELNQFQPGAKTIESFLFSPSTAVSDPVLVIKAMESEFLKLGGHVKHERISRLSNTMDLGTLDIEKYDWVINSAGAGALSLAKTLAVGENFELMPFLGIYWGSKSLGKSIKVPLYPVPHPVNPFLGVHLTPTSKGFGKIGPTAIPVLGPEQYGLNSRIDLKDLGSTLSGAVAMMKGDKHSLAKIIKTELRYLLRSNMIEDAARLFPKVKETGDWVLVPGGIRSQLINRHTGALLDDFLIETERNVTHILNAVSPGWTGALSFAEWIIESRFGGMLDEKGSSYRRCRLHRQRTI